MVAQRSRLDSPEAPDVEDAPTQGREGPDFSPYARVVDRGAAGFEGGRGSTRITPLVQHEAFKARRRLSLADRKELAIKQAAIRIACGVEDRSFRELGREIGCSHTAIGNRLRRVCEALGLRRFLVGESTRAKQRATRARNFALRTQGGAISANAASA
jgi:hypothetical protein